MYINNPFTILNYKCFYKRQLLREPATLLFSNVAAFRVSLCTVTQYRNYRAVLSTKRRVEKKPLTHRARWWGRLESWPPL